MEILSIRSVFVGMFKCEYWMLPVMMERVLESRQVQKRNRKCKAEVGCVYNSAIFI